MGHKGTSNRRAIERLLDEYSICEHWMTTKVRTVAPSHSIEHARDLLKRYRINQLPVVVRGKLLGIVTDRDIRSSSGLRDSAAARAADQRVQSLMSRPAIALGCHSTLLNAAEVMRRSRIGRGSHRSRRNLGGHRDSQRHPGCVRRACEWALLSQTAKALVRSQICLALEPHSRGESYFEGDRHLKLLVETFRREGRPRYSAVFVACLGPPLRRVRKPDSLQIDALFLLNRFYVADDVHDARADFGFACGSKVLALVLKSGSPERHIETLMGWDSVAAIDGLVNALGGKHAAIIPAFKSGLQHNRFDSVLQLRERMEQIGCKTHLFLLSVILNAGIVIGPIVTSRPSAQF